MIITMLLKNKHLGIERENGRKLRVGLCLDGRNIDNLGRLFSCFPNDLSRVNIFITFKKSFIPN